MQRIHHSQNPVTAPLITGGAIRESVYDHARGVARRTNQRTTASGLCHRWTASDFDTLRARHGWTKAKVLKALDELAAAGRIQIANSDGYMVVLLPAVEVPR